MINIGEPVEITRAGYKVLVFELDKDGDKRVLEIDMDLVRACSPHENELILRKAELIYDN